MGTCYYLQRPDGKLFDLDKAYGLADYLRADRPADPTSEGWPCSLGADLDTLVLVLAEHQPWPCCEERVALARRMLDFADGQPLVLYDEHRVPESEFGLGGYSDRVIGERFTRAAVEHSRTCRAVDGSSL
jgi:hypothetical protein